MRRKEQRIFIALFGGPFFAIRDGLEIMRQAEVVVLDLIPMAEKMCTEPSGQCRLAHAFRTREQQRLRQAILRQHLLDRLRDVGVAPKLFKYMHSRSPTHRALWRRSPAARPRP